MKTSTLFKEMWIMEGQLKQWNDIAFEVLS